MELYPSLFACLSISDLYFLAISFFISSKKVNISQHFLRKDENPASKMSSPSQNRVKCMAAKHLPLMETNK